jgi:hypothetical protein
MILCALTALLDYVVQVLKETAELQVDFWTISMYYSGSLQLYLQLRMPQLRKTSTKSSNPLAAGS